MMALLQIIGTMERKIAMAKAPTKVRKPKAKEAGYDEEQIKAGTPYIEVMGG